MARAEIFSGICGFTTIVKAQMKGSYCTRSIESECKAIQSFAENLPEVDPFRAQDFHYSLCNINLKGHVLTYCCANHKQNKILIHRDYYFQSFNTW